MRRWLKVLRAEFTREVTSALRYPLELGTGVFIMYVIFMGIFSGARSITGGEAVEGVEGLQIAFCMWFFAIIAINSMSVDIESEARAGSLEQVYLCSPGFTATLWIRGIAHIILGSAAVIALALAIQATTGRWISVPPGSGLALAACTLLSVAGVCGLGIVLGGLSLVYKRIGQTAALVQFGLFLLAFSDTAGVPGLIGAIARHAPFTSGIWMLRQISGGHSLQPQALGTLALESAVYVVLGTLVFNALKRVAMRAGTLAHY